MPNSISLERDHVNVLALC